jgi:hypothetical protein
MIYTFQFADGCPEGYRQWLEENVGPSVEGFYDHRDMKWNWRYERQTILNEGDGTVWHVPTVIINNEEHAQMFMLMWGEYVRNMPSL